MTTEQLELLAVFEGVGAILIFRLWRAKARKSLVFKIVWTLFLLIPLLGPLMYGFIVINPSSHGDDPSDSTGGIDPGGSY